MSFTTLSAILRGQWLIDRSYVSDHLPLIHGIITGQASGAELFKGSAEMELPLVYSKGTRIEAYAYNRDTGKYGINEAAIPAGSIAVIPVIGPVMKYNGECGEPGMIKRSAWVVELSKLDNIAGFIFHIDSPGGQADGTPQFAQLIKDLSKPKIAYVDGGAYSAGMWIASACDKIVLSHEFSGVGSIGAYTTIVDYSGYFEKQGFKVTEVYPDESSEKNLGYRKAIKGDITDVKADIAELANFFIDSFAQNRGSKLTSDVWNKGKTFKGQEAISIGLADHIGSFAFAANLITNPSNKTDMKLILALKGVDNPTTEQIDLANGELTTEGITNVTLVAESFIAESAAVTEENKRLSEEIAAMASTTTELASTKEELATANTSLATANERITELEEKIAKGPGATHKTETGDDTPPGGDDEDTDSILANLPHNRNADKYGFGN